jgi:hypothetical protein
MEQTEIFGPFFATMALTFAVWVTMFARRVPFILSSGMTQDQMATPGELARVQPASVANPADNFRNLFEMPVLFYALCLYLYAVGQVDGLHVAAAWVFVAFRALHSGVHCTFNLVNLRFGLYLVSALALWLMIARAALAHFAA